MRLNFLAKLKYQLSTIILSVGIKYSMHDLLCDINNYTNKWRYALYTVNDVNKHSGISCEFHY